METAKRIGNVNILDMRNATEASAGEIERIGNVNVLITSPETAALAARIPMGNINCAVQMPSGAPCKTVMGHVHINRDYFEHLTEPIALFVMGHVLVDAGIPGEKLDEMIESIVVMGHVYCPEPLVGLVQSKIAHAMGHIRPYPGEARLYPGLVELDEALLESLDDGTTLAVVRTLRVLGDLPEDLFQRKIGAIHALGGILCREESLATLKTKLAPGSQHVRVIPVGHSLHEDPLALDGPTLDGLREAKLYCTEMVTIGSDVTEEMLEGHLASLVGRDLILCPAALKTAFGAVCDLLENRVLFYEGELMLFDNEHTLRASRFEYLQTAATAVVRGSLTIDPDVPASLLAERFDTIHNLGAIRCTPDQMGAIEARLGLQEGELSDSTLEPADEDPTGMGNVNILTL